MVTYGYWESYYLLVYNWWRHHFQLYGFYYAFSGVPRGKNVFNMEYLEGRKVFLILNRDFYLQQRQYFGRGRQSTRPNIWKRRSLNPRGFVIDILLIKRTKWFYRFFILLASSSYFPVSTNTHIKNSLLGFVPARVGSCPVLFVFPCEHKDAYNFFSFWGFVPAGVGSCPRPAVTAVTKFCFPGCRYRCILRWTTC